jgi:L-seryl-tRNA(Ser) seleniumtransferase
MAKAAHGYSNLEYDLESGRRGSRYVHCVELLKEITGAPDALVVNNNAAAVVLGLNTMAEGRRVLVSRGELVEIGGGFRIPDMLSRSGARLREVGTTNRTRVEDYREGAKDGEAAAILKVHRSNFRISGFTEDAPLADLVSLAREMGLGLFHDLGSGLLVSPALLGLPPEPTAMESLQAGTHAVAISGDKLLGGPQSGILLGEARLMESMRQNPLCRAFRVDKVTLAGLEATLRHYLDPEEALREIPALRALAMPVSDLEPRAKVLQEGLRAMGFRARTASGYGRVGGGTYPGTEVPTVTVRVEGGEVGADALAAALRRSGTPVVARVDQGDVVLDLRVIHPDEDAVVLAGFREISRGSRGEN